MISFNRQVKFWLLITLVHVGLIYAFSRADAVEIARTIVTASVVTSEVQAPENGVQTPSTVEKAMDTQTMVAQKIVTHTSHQTTNKSSAAEPASDDGLRNVQANSITSSTANALALTQLLNNSSNDKANDSAQAFTAPTHIGGHLHNPKPPYPAFSKDAGEEGVVAVSAMVEANGRPSSVDVVKSSGYSRLDRSARDTVLNQYRFTPAMQGGQAVRYRYRFDIRFNLQKN